MPYQLFHDHFPDEAERETRVIHLSGSHPFTGVPPGEYGLLEAFCNEDDCDCRRVMWMVNSEREKNIVAVVAYGWGSPEFYRNWFGGDDPGIIQEMRGPVLNLASPQASYAPAIVNMLTRSILTDKQYIARVKRHYTQFRNKIETGSRFLA
jgi:hypothetical protein